MQPSQNGYPLSQGPFQKDNPPPYSNYKLKLGLISG
jgi:hypothetical protein